MGGTVVFVGVSDWTGVAVSDGIKVAGMTTGAEVVFAVRGVGVLAMGVEEGIA